MMHGRILLSLFFLPLLVSGLSVGKSATELFQRAEMEYKEARYGNAIRLYDSLLHAGYTDVRVYNNLGNAYFKTGNHAKSRLQFERAFLLAPDDQDIRHNLQVVTARLPDRIETVPQFFLVQWWNDIKRDQSLPALFSWSCLFLSLVCACAIVYYWFEALLIRRLMFFTGIFFTLLFCLNVFVLLDKQEDLAAHRMAIVMENSLPVKSTADKTAVDLFVIHEGLKVEIIDSIDHWIKIRLSDGKYGWVHSRSVERI